LAKRFFPFLFVLNKNILANIGELIIGEALDFVSRWPTHANRSLCDSLAGIWPPTGQGIRLVAWPG
jgi:hypothetical protein